MSMLKFNNSIILLLMALALGACSSAPKNQPDGNEDQSSLAKTGAYAEAISALKNNETALAAKILQQLSVDTPEQPYVFTNLGLAYLRLKNNESAEQAFRQAIEQNKLDAVAHNHLGILQRQQGKFDDALERYQRAIDIDGGYARAHLNLGILFDIYLQDLDKALEQYQRYQSLTKPEDTQVSAWIVDIERRLNSKNNQSQG